MLLMHAQATSRQTSWPATFLLPSRRDGSVILKAEETLAWVWPPLQGQSKLVDSGPQLPTKTLHLGNQLTLEFKTSESSFHH